MLICCDCGQPKGSYHRHWCGMEHQRQIQYEAWEEGYGTGIRDERESQEVTSDMVQPARVNPYEDPSRMWVEDE